MAVQQQAKKPESRLVKGEQFVHNAYIRSNARFQYALGVVQAFPAFKTSPYANILEDYYDDRG